MQSDFGYENGHLIISLKFFKFVSDDDINKEQREVEIIRTISFIDIEGFNSSFTDILVNKKTASIKNDAKNFTLVKLKNLFEALSSADLDKYSEINSTFCNILLETLRIQNSFVFMFAFINQNESTLSESTVTLELMNKFKEINTEFFFDYVQEVDMDISDINQNKDEYYIAELIVRFDFN
jgi:hypothetical protein